MRKFIYILIFVILAIVALYTIPLKIQSFEEAYAKNDQISSSINQFRQIPLKSIIKDGIQWDYLTIGQGEKTILFLHGMSGTYDIWWQEINHFKNDYKIITLTYPAVNSLKDMGEAVMEILDKENIKEIIVVGSSLGGYFTQYLVSTYPERIEKAVFGNTFPVNDLIKKENKSKEWLFRTAPEWLVMYVMRAGLNKDILPAANNSKLLEAFMVEQFSGRMSKKQFIARYECVIDSFDKKETLDIPKLIIESDNDPLVKLPLREKLIKEYPEARVETLHHLGHFPYVNEPDKYNEILTVFFEEASIAENDTINEQN